MRYTYQKTGITIERMAFSYNAYVRQSLAIQPLIPVFYPED